ncbi:hypothetical protein GS532_21080 [Rhodococcus hoagii]|uniref:hypothetical protein n=1 Tax=Rhodococcus hoagii TaxID=43767 RepID=UPI000A1140C4|nr:hypothetical protein [Prescottella equi]MBM4686230.1 hypothetical protein [Prescottella equi]ORL77812.1 hypothetical protein A5N75_08250 [Prescottella equi]
MATLELTPAQTRTIAGQYRDDQTAEINRLKKRNETLEASVSELTSQLDSAEHDRDHFKREAVEAAEKLAVIEQALKGEPDKWDRWQDVPQGVVYEDKDGDRYVNSDGVRWWVRKDSFLAEAQSSIASHRMNDTYAPFVRAN